MATEMDLDLQKANPGSGRGRDQGIRYRRFGPSPGTRLQCGEIGGRMSAVSLRRVSHDRSRLTSDDDVKQILATLSSSDVRMVLLARSQGLPGDFQRTIEPIRVGRRGLGSRIARRLNQLRLEIQLIPFRIRRIVMRMRQGSWDFAPFYWYQTKYRAKADHDITTKSLKFHANGGHEIRN